MAIDVPTGACFHWNPYTEKCFTVVTPPGSDIESSVSEEGLKATTLKYQDFALARTTISALRSEATDAKILHTVQRLPYRTLAVTLAALEASPTLLMELCEKDRGNVVFQLMQVMGGEQCGEIVQFVMQNAYRLSTHQSGCIAFTRVYDGATSEQQQEMCAFVMDNFVELCSHPFGNYVVQRALQGAIPPVYVDAGEFLSNSEFLEHTAANKFGSHVIETYLKNAPPELVVRVCGVLLRDEIAVSKLAYHNIGNYTMQRALRQLLLSTSVTHPFVQWCLKYIPTLVANSQYALNITRALGFQSTLHY